MAEKTSHSIYVNVPLTLGDRNTYCFILFTVPTILMLTPTNRSTMSLSIAVEDETHILLVSDDSPHSASWLKKGPDNREKLSNFGRMWNTWEQLKEQALKTGVTKAQQGFVLVLDLEFGDLELVDVVFKAMMSKHAKAFYEYLGVEGGEVDNEGKDQKIEDVVCERDRDGDHEMKDVGE